MDPFRVYVVYVQGLRLAGSTLCLRYAVNVADHDNIHEEVHHPRSPHRSQFSRVTGATLYGAQHVPRVRRHSTLSSNTPGLYRLMDGLATPLTRDRQNEDNSTALIIKYEPGRAEDEAATMSPPRSPQSQGWQGTATATAASSTGLD